MNLWKHQEAFVRLTDQLPHAAIFAEPGTGKTRALIEVLRRDYNRQRAMKRTLIFCPLSTCKQWGKAIEQYAPKIPTQRILVLTGDGKKRTAQLAKEGGGSPAIVVTNYEAVGIKSFYDELLHWSPEILVLDESHRVKDPGSQRAKKIYPLCMTARRRLIATGTPILNSLLDLFGQYKALDPEIFGHSFWKFRERFFYDKNAGMPAHVHFPDWRVRPESMSYFTDVLGRTSIQAKLHECLDMPPLVQVKIPIEMSPEQRKTYASMEKAFVAELAGVTSIAEFAMTKTLRLRQILTGFVAESAEAKPAFFKENPRMDALEELLEQLGDKQVIIWTTFQPLYQQIGNLCSKMTKSFDFLTGLQSISEKERSLQKFRSGECQILISNPSAGGTGIDGLQCSSYAIYFDRGYSLEHYLQSQARNYRAGSKEKVIHYVLECPETVDEVIGLALDSKKDIGDSLLEWARKKSSANKNS